MWQPTAFPDALYLRALLTEKIRAFFAKRNVLEVETPLLQITGNPDSNIESFSVNAAGERVDQLYFLQTSPEFAMKRLLAAGSPDIFQLCKAFRAEESGRMHVQEFTILEWYRLNFDHHQLMSEVEELLHVLCLRESDQNKLSATRVAWVANKNSGLGQTTVGEKRYGLKLLKAHKYTYQELFMKYLAIDPLVVQITELKNCAQKMRIDFGSDETREENNRDFWLNLLFCYGIEPILASAKFKNRPVFVYEFPASQAALARLCKHDPRVAERFEVYLNGIELGNGFHELKDASEQRERFEEELAKRREEGKFAGMPIDEKFLAALKAGLPDCSGIAIGFDRLVMLALNAQHIAEVISFGEELA